MPSPVRRRLGLRRALVVAACALGACVCGCMRLGSAPNEPPGAPQPPPPAPTPAPRSEAYEAFEAWRKDLLTRNPWLSQVNGAFVIGVDVSGSAHANQVLEFTIKLLSDACHYFFSPGDLVVIVPWDSRVREQNVTTLEVTNSQEAVDSLGAAFEALENLVDPESRGSNLLDARGYCLEQALKQVKKAKGKRCGAVFIFTDIRTPDMDFGRLHYTPARLRELRRLLTGDEAAEFDVWAYQVAEHTQVITHTLVGSGENLAVAPGLDRERVAVGQTPAPLPPPRTKPPDTAAWRALLIILAVACALALVALPLTWKHRLTVAGVQETMRAFGGRVMVQSGSGVSPKGVVLFRVNGVESRPLLALEGRGPQVVAVARRGVRLNDGRTELVLPMGRPCTLRLAIDGVPGEQALDVQVRDFLSVNSGQVIGMGVALIVMVLCIIG